MLILMEYNVAINQRIQAGTVPWTSRQECSQSSPAVTTSSPTGGFNNHLQGVLQNYNNHLQVVLQNYNHNKATVASSPMHSASARVRPGEAIDMYIHRNGELIEESRWLTMMASDGSASYIDDQGSRTVVGSIQFTN